MAHIMAVIGGNQDGKKIPSPGNYTAALELKKRNEQLEKELIESKEREEEMRKKLQSARESLRVAEEAEERLCSQLGDLEAETLEQARDYHAKVGLLTEQILRAHTLLQESGSSVSISIT